MTSAWSMFGEVSECQRKKSGKEDETEARALGIDITTTSKTSSASLPPVLCAIPYFLSSFRACHVLA